jgi:hypothetical protein
MMLVHSKYSQYKSCVTNSFTAGYATLDYRGGGINQSWDSGLRFKLRTFWTTIWPWNSMETTAFCNTEPCSLVEVGQHFRGDAGGIIHLWNVCLLFETTRHNIAQRCHLHTHHCENLKSHSDIRKVDLHQD